MYPLHPLTVHFPIALLLASGLLTALYLRSGQATLASSAFHCMVLGWLGTLAALLTGAWDAYRQLPLERALAWVNAHAFSGIAVLLIFGWLLLQRRRDPTILEHGNPRRRAYLLGLGLGCALVAFSGWTGGYLVYYLQLGIRS